MRVAVYLGLLLIIQFAWTGNALAADAQQSRGPVVGITARELREETWVATTQCHTSRERFMNFRTGKSERHPLYAGRGLTFESDGTLLVQSLTLTPGFGDEGTAQTVWTSFWECRAKCASVRVFQMGNTQGTCRAEKRHVESIGGFKAKTPINTTVLACDFTGVRSLEFVPLSVAEKIALSFARQAAARDP